MNHRTQSRPEKRKRQPDAAGTVFVCAESGAALGAIAEAMRAGGAARFSLKRVLGEGELHSALSAGPDPTVAVISCGPETGLTETILRHAFLLKLYGVRRVLLTVVDGGGGTDARQFDALAARFRDFAGRAGVADADVAPLSALADRISGLAAAKAVPDLPLRLRVTAATPRAQHEWRCQGAIEGGAPQSGQAITAFPAEKPGRVTQLDETGIEPAADRTVAFVVETEAQLKPGDLLAAGDPLPDVSDQIAAHLAWTATQRLYPGRKYLLQIGGETVAATVTALKHRVDPRTLEPLAARFLDSGGIGFCNLSLERPIVFDRDPRFHATHRFRLLGRNGERDLAVGFPAYGLRRATNLTRQEIPVHGAARAAMKGQRPCVLWFTGLSGAGKSSTASAVDQNLHALGRHTYLLDGDNVRHGLSRDLGFTEADRVENIRRVAEVARLMVDAGLIVLVSFISPFRSERRMARELFEDGRFIEIFMDTPLPVCEARDMKGLYRKARAGELVNFTGIDSPYEEPETPEIRLRPDDGSADAQAAIIIDFLRDRGMI